MEGTKLTIKEAATKLDLTPQQVRNLCRYDKLPSEKLGNSWILNETEVNYYKSTNSCGKTEDKNLSQADNLNSISFNEPIALSFFTGAMGLDLGIEKAGFKTLLACEVDKASRKTITRNKPDIALIGDIRDYSAEEIREKAGLGANDEIDLVVGGPPCQAFSTAGKRKGFEDERGNVFLTFIDRILELRPKYAVIENVRGILSAPLSHRPHNQRGSEFQDLNFSELKGGALLNIVNILRDNGYGVSFNLYNAANFGTPQKRERVIIMASRTGEKLPYLTPTHSENGEFGLPKWKSFRNAVSNMKTDSENHVNFPEKRLKYYRMLGPGEYWKNLPLETQKEAMGKSFYSGGGKTGFFRRLAWDKPSPTLVTHPAMPATDLAHPEKNRPLSIEEYKRVQQFPDSYIIEGSLIEQYRQIGNAVPVGLGKAVGKAIIDHMNGVSAIQYQGFKYSRYNNTDDERWELQTSKVMNQYKMVI
jgi:DNA (cytosine-5)-methyltransferase 1